MKAKINYIFNNKKIVIPLLICLILIVSLGVTYAFFKPFIGQNIKTHLDVESYNTDQLTFTKGEDITIDAEQQNFGPNMGNLSAEVAKLVANRNTKQATQ